VSDPAKRLKANKVIEGQACGWCSRPIQFGDDTAICTACDTPHHGICWDERQGCSLATCENAPLRQLEPPAGPATPQRPAPVPLGGGSAEQRAANRARARTLRPGMMPCPHCNRPIQEDAEICRYCRKAPTEDGVYRGPQVTAPGATASLVCGIIGILFSCVCFIGLILGIVAIVKANEARRAIAEDPRYSGQGMATAGLVLGIISLALSGLTVLGYLTSSLPDIP